LKLLLQTSDVSRLLSLFSVSKTAAEADPSKRQKLNQNKRSRTRQCKIFAETGSCKFDVGCKFAHVPGAKAGEDVSARLSESLSTGEIGSGATSSEAKADEDVTMT
jgi:hypothetical protein